MDGWAQDFKYAIRSIAGTKRLAAVVVATLALGLGANTAVFSVLNAVVLQPLPYDEPDRLVRVYTSVGGEDSYLPAPALVELREQSSAVDIAAVFTYSPEGVDLTEGGLVERVRMLPIGAGYFRILHVTPALGAEFDRGDERDNARLAIVSSRIWRTHLGGAPDAVGKSLTLNGQPHRIVAVLPDGFRDPFEPGIDVWTPIGLQPGPQYSWDNYYLSAIGRVRPGMDIVRAQAELTSIAAGLPWNIAATAARPRAHVVRLQDDTVGGARTLLWLLLGAVGLLLAITCVNVASLFLARGAARETDLAVRSALGGSRWRLIRQLLVESIVLSVAGGVAGLAVARAVAQAFRLVAPPAISRIGATALDWQVVAFGVVVALLSGVAVGIAPAIQLTASNLDSVLRESSRSGSGSRRLARSRNVLVVSQIALALVLLIGAGLLLRSFDRLRSVALGVKTANVLTFEVHLPSGRYQDPQQRARFHPAFHRRIAALPGVRAAGAISRLPVTGSYHRWGTARADVTTPRNFQPQQRVVEGDYFRALQIPVLRGRTFDAADDERAPRRVVVSEALVRQLFAPGEDPIGRPLRVAGTTAPIIGVVGDVAISARGAAPPMVYHSHRQFAGGRNWALSQVVALERPSPAIVDALRQQLATIDPALVLYQPRLLDEVVGGGTANERFALWLVAAFALLALMVAAIGVYGVLSYSVARRRREMGIRLALGAPAEAVLLLIVRDGARLAAAGIVVGVAGAFAATRALRSLLFEVSATEPAVFAIAAVALATVAIAASWMPARAATRVDPAAAMFTT